jgi:hypothetical protein
MKDLKPKTIRGGLATICVQAANFCCSSSLSDGPRPALKSERLRISGMVTAFTGVLALFRDFGLSSGRSAHSYYRGAERTTWTSSGSRRRPQRRTLGLRQAQPIGAIRRLESLASGQGSAQFVQKKPPDNDVANAFMKRRFFYSAA